MHEDCDAPREFTDEQLREACREIGEEARHQAFAVGRPVMFLRDGRRVLLHADGREEDAGPAELFMPPEKIVHQ